MSGLVSQPQTWAPSNPHSVQAARPQALVTTRRDVASREMSVAATHLPQFRGGDAVRRRILPSVNQGLAVRCEAPPYRQWQGA